MKKVLIICLIASLLVSSVVGTVAFAENNGIATYSNGTLQIAFNTNVKSITVTYNGTSTTYTSQSYVQVPIGVTVTWTATCADGYVIEGGSNTGTFTMTSYYQLAPHAEKLVTYPLTISLNSNVASISVTIDGTTTRYTSSTVVNVRSGASVGWAATAVTGYNLSSSSGSFTMTTASSIAPTTSVKTFTVTVTVNAGVEYIRVNGTRYDTSTTLSFSYGASVSWEASPKTGYTLSQTSGSFEVTSAKTIAPTTTAKTYILTVTVNTGVQSVVVKYGSNSKTFTSSGTLSVTHGTSVSWQANSKAGYTLSQTSGSFTMTNASTIAPATSVKSFKISIANYTPSNADAQFSWKLEWTSGKSLSGAVSDYVTMTVASDGKSVTLTFVKDFSAGEMVLTCYATADPTVKATCTVKCGS